jgi:hypothetical protein
MPDQLSFNDEERIIAELFSGRLPLRREFCVDVGAGDGVTMSNTHFLLAGGWAGLLVEYEPQAFAKLAAVHAGSPLARLARCRATPEGIVPLLGAFGVPRDFDFLSLDIDGYDHFVLDAILAEYRPALVCTEINEAFPPPVKFVVKYHPEFRWNVDKFFGHSIAKVAELCARRGYGIVRLEYNNAFLAPRELLAGAGLEALTAERAYREGYVDRPDRMQRYPWNADVEHLRDLAPEEVVEWAGRQFGEKYAGQFECSL